MDGAFREDLSSLPGAAGLEAGSLRARLAGNGHVLEEHLGRHASLDGSFFAALNTAFFADGAFVSVAEGVTVEQPVQLLYRRGLRTARRDRSCAQFDCGAIRRGAQSDGNLRQPDPGAHVTNAVTEVLLGRGARVEHGRLQNENQRAFHISSVQAVQQRDSHWISHSIATGARLARNQIQTRLNGEGAEAVLNGLFLGRGDQLIDHHTVVDHAQPHCESHEFYHGILADRARGVFNGKIFVRPDAQKTNAKQTNRNLLLSENAVIDTKPQLEIFADDVKCTHGATIGQLSDEALFYLRSRGIGAEHARRMLIHAFASDVVGRLTIPALREQLDQLLTERFESAAT